MNRRARQGLTVLLALALAATLVGIGYVASIPSAQYGDQQYTEFYLLDSNGNADFPKVLAPGETYGLTVGVVNHEAETTRYRLTVAWNDTTTERRALTLDTGDRWKRTVAVVAPTTPGRYRLHLRLYRDDADEPYRQLRLWIAVEQ